MKKDKHFIEKIIEENNLGEMDNRIPIAIREILLLYYTEKLSQSEIAGKLNLPVSIIKHHISKGEYLIKKEFGFPDYKKAFEILYGKVQKNL